MNGRIRTISLLLVAVWLLSAVPQLHAQIDNKYYLGNQLLQQQEYEEAFEIFRQLHSQRPERYLFLEKATEALVNLKRYDDAISMTRQAVQNSQYPGQAMVRMGEIQHIQGDTTAAFATWEQTLEKYGDRYQIYLSLARAMSDRRAFGHAVEVYEKARKLFSNSSLLSTELANTYMQAGQYQKAVGEFLNLVKQEPDRIDYVQRSLIRYGDEFLHDTAILEIDEFLDRLPMDHPSHRNLHQLQLWLLLERNLYRRALAEAKAYEQRTSHATYSLYGLGAKLLSENEFELAEEAYRYYVDRNLTTAKYQSMQELSHVYSRWADYLSEYNLAYASRRDSLYQKAFDVLKQLQQEAPFFDKMGQVLGRQAELAIDYLNDPRLARNYLQALQSRNNPANIAQQYYVEGRIRLYEGEYDRARIAFTKSNKQEEIGELSEKTRYYLALTDFYSGDYEFSKIQLSALEKQNTSYYANDAVRLRIWIQKGLNADSTGSLLEPFARGVELFNRGRDREAAEQLVPLLSGSAPHPLTDEALLVLSKNVTPRLTRFTYAALGNYLDRWGKASPLRERLLWEKARIADQVVTRTPDSGIPLPQPGGADSLSTPWDGRGIVLPSTREELLKIYEEILLRYPDGFYASFARERIRELKNPQT